MKNKLFVLLPLLLLISVCMISCGGVTKAHKGYCVQFFIRNAVEADFSASLSQDEDSSTFESLFNNSGKYRARIYQNGDINIRTKTGDVLTFEQTMISSCEDNVEDANVFYEHKTQLWLLHLQKEGSVLRLIFTKEGLSGSATLTYTIPA